ncbi:MAG: biopolymer transporter ExbD [Bdellovibrionota bacterium]
MLGKRKKVTAKSRKRFVTPSGLALTSMLDILTTILFFLLKNYSTVQTTFNVSEGLSLPQSTTVAPPPDSSLHLVVTQTAVLLDGVELVPVVNGDIPREHLYRDNVTIVRLAQALQQHKKRSQYIEKRSDTHSFSGMIVMQADKNLEFKILKKVIYTAGITDFVMLKLAALKKDA